LLENPPFSDKYTIIFVNDIININFNYISGNLFVAIGLKLRPFSSFSGDQISQFLNHGEEFKIMFDSSYLVFAKIECLPWLEWLENHY